jgi:hypothetical protein
MFGAVEGNRVHLRRGASFSGRGVHLVTGGLCVPNRITWPLGSDSRGRCVTVSGGGPMQDSFYSSLPCFAGPGRAALLCFHRIQSETHA